jgi:S1-C subfamily serine protease
MVALQSLALCLSLTSAGQIVLLDFYSDSCPPCRQMAPLIDQMITAGYPVKKINVAHDPTLARQYGVSGVPCFIVVGPSGEVGRVVGGRPDTSEIVALFQQAGFRPGAASVAQAPAAQPRTNWGLGAERQQSVPSGTIADSRRPRGDELSPTSASQSVIDRAMAASVRLKIEDGGKSFSYGSGTIIDMQGEEALVLTCGHVFHDSQGKGRISVDLFDESGAHHSVPGQLIHFDEKRDVGLVAIRPGRPIEPMKVGGQGCKASLGMRVFSIGCDRGAIPSVRESRVSNINRYLGPPNIEVAGAPVDGRSGGGLFTADGTLIGVCNAADPQDDEGIYAALEAVHAELTAANLSFIYNGGSGREMPGTLMAGSSAPRTDGLGMPDAFPRAERPNPAATPMSQPLLEDDDTEVILIVRSRSNPERKAETIFINRPTKELLRSIATQRQLESAPQNTSLQVTTPLTAATPAATLR